MSVTIYHNPDCGTSRNALALIGNAGIEPRIVEYLKTPPSRETVKGLAARTGVPLRSLLRRKGTPFDALGLGDPEVSDDALLDAVALHPILLNRPIILTPRGAKLCRPSELVLDLLETPQRTAFVKEDGEPVVIAIPLPAGGRDAMAAMLAAAGLPAADLARPDRHLFRFETTLGEPVGFGGWEGCGDDRLVRSIVVPASHHGRRYGKAIALTLERLAGAHGAKRLHLLAMEAAPFFETLGYSAADRYIAPPEIAASEEFTLLCPATARYLTKDVRTSW